VRENGSGLTAADVRDVLLATREVAQLNEQIRVGIVAAGQRDGVFTAAGHKKPDSAVASVLGVDRGVAREIVRGAEYTSPQIDAHGDEAPAVLPTMAAAFRAGRASLRHVDAIGRLLDSTVARQLPPEVRVRIEAQIAAVADENTPTRLARYGRELIADHHQHAPAFDDDEHPPVQVNELRSAPRGAVVSNGGGRPSLLCRRSGGVKLAAAGTGDRRER
jgi:5-methylcytosine-specific restriction protein A